MKPGHNVFVTASLRKPKSIRQQIHYLVPVYRTSRFLCLLCDLVPYNNWRCHSTSVLDSRLSSTSSSFSFQGCSINPSRLPVVTLSVRPVWNAVWTTTSNVLSVKKVSKRYVKPICCLIFRHSPIFACFVIVCLTLQYLACRKYTVTQVLDNIIQKHLSGEHQERIKLHTEETKELSE